MVNEDITTAAEKAVEAALASRNAVHAAKNAAQAVESAREAQLASAVASAVKQAFNIEDTGGQKRFVDVSRVPLICQAIIGIQQSLEAIERKMVTQDQFSPVKSLVYGVVGLILTAVVGALLALIIQK